VQQKIDFGPDSNQTSTDDVIFRTDIKALISNQNKLKLIKKAYNV